MTSIEFLVEKLSNYDSKMIELFSNEIKQAKEIEKKQIIEAWENGYEHGACVNEDKNKYHGIQYYNEIFKNK